MVKSGTTADGGTNPLVKAGFFGCSGLLCPSRPGTGIASSISVLTAEPELVGLNPGITGATGTAVIGSKTWELVDSTGTGFDAPDSALVEPDSGFAGLKLVLMGFKIGLVGLKTG